MCNSVVLPLHWWHPVAVPLMTMADYFCTVRNLGGEKKLKSKDKNSNWKDIEDLLVKSQ